MLASFSDIINGNLVISYKVILIFQITTTSNESNMQVQFRAIYCTKSNTFYTVPHLPT